MHFVICVFIALVCLITVILFKEVFPKWFKFVLALIASYTSGYAVAILIRKIAMMSEAYAKPTLFPLVWICSAVVLVLILVVTLIKNKKKS